MQYTLRMTSLNALQVTQWVVLEAQLRSSLARLHHNQTEPSPVRPPSIIHILLGLSTLAGTIIAQPDRGFNVYVILFPKLTICADPSFQ